MRCALGSPSRCGVGGGIDRNDLPARAGCSCALTGFPGSSPGVAIENDSPERRSRKSLHRRSASRVRTISSSRETFSTTFPSPILQKGASRVRATGSESLRVRRARPESRWFRMVTQAGFEPATSCSGGQSSTALCRLDPSEKAPPPRRLSGGLECSHRAPCSPFAATLQPRERIEDRPSLRTLAAGASDAWRGRGGFD